MTSLPVIQTGPEACAKCKGACCKGLPGETLPRQWMFSQWPGTPGYNVIDWERVEEAFLSGKWVIDWWEGDPRAEREEDERASSAPYIRPRHSESREGLRDDIIFGQGECAFLTESGCTLPEVMDDTRNPSSPERPAGCSYLTAKLEEKENGEIELHCDYPDGKQFKRSAAILWLPFSERLYEVVEAAEEKMFAKEDVA